MTKKTGDTAAPNNRVGVRSAAADNEDMTNPDDEVVFKYTIDQVLGMKVESWEDFSDVL